MAILGAVPVAVSTASGVISTVGGAITSVFGNEKDAKRRAEADALAASAMQGNDLALLKLRCLAGDPSAKADACSTGAHPDACGSTPCGYATPSARGYAAGLVAKVQASRAGTQVATAVVQDVVQPALNAAGYSIVPTVNATTLMLGAAALVAVYLIVKR